jgi:two-component system, OmpR family, response regulator
VFTDELIYVLNKKTSEMETKKEKIKVFFVDDDPIYLKMLESNLKQSKSYTAKVFTYSSGEETLKNLHHNPNIVVLDYYLSNADKNAMNGLDTLKEIKKQAPHIEVVMLSGQDKIDVAVHSIKSGAFDYVPKSESAFVRTQNAINNIVLTKKLKDTVRSKKIWMRIFGSLLILTIITFLTLSFMYKS